MTADRNPLGVPAHRHRNSDGSEGGWVAEAATVAPTVYVGCSARIWGGTIRGGTIRGGTIRGGTIYTTRHVLAIGPIGSEDQHLTLTRTDTGHRLTIGCWNGEHTIDQLEAEVMRRAPEHWPEYKAARALCRLRIAEWDAEREAQR